MQIPHLIKQTVPHTEPFFPFNVSCIYTIVPSFSLPVGIVPSPVCFLRLPATKVPVRNKPNFALGQKKTLSTVRKWHREITSLSLGLYGVLCTVKTHSRASNLKRKRAKELYHRCYNVEYSWCDNTFAEYFPPFLSLSYYTTCNLSWCPPIRCCNDDDDDFFLLLPPPPLLLHTIAKILSL